MPHSTRAFHNRIAIVFDFDLTLGEGSIDVLLRKLDIDPDRYRRQYVHPLDEDGWDHSLARFKGLIDLSRELGGAITLDLLREVGRDTPLYPGVPEMFDRVATAARDVAEGVDVEFHVLTAGFAEVAEAAPIADRFATIVGSRGHYDDAGRLVFPKQVVTYPEKQRYLLQLAKGLSREGPDAPADVYREVADADWHVPLDQVVYVGDGASDLPAFSLIGDHGGLALGVFRPNGSAAHWSDGKRVDPRRRVQNLAAADYREGSELLCSLCLAVESIAKLVALRRLADGE